MNLESFSTSVEQDATPPEGLSDFLTAMWYAAKGDWEQAHTLSQKIDDPEGAWIHAHLHREEGDPGNARYWYDRAGRAPATDSIAEERQRLIAYAINNA